MCRNIKTLFNFDPPATDAEIMSSAQQFVRKLSGFSRPSRVNQVAFDAAIRDVAQVARRLIDDLETEATPKNREAETAKARKRSRARFSASQSVE